MKLPKDFVELFELLNAREVKALIVGGYAFVYHARPRTTKDIDIWIEPTPENVSRLLEALDDFGFGTVGLKAEDFLTPGRFVQLGYPPHRVDILTSLKGLTFEEAWAKRVEDVLEGTRVCFVGKEELILNKEAVGRLQDRADVSVLKRPKIPKRNSD